MDGKQKRIILSILGTILLLAVVGGIVAYFMTRSAAPVNSYKECVDQGYPVMESYPERCAGPDGRVFTNPEPASNGANGTDQQSDSTVPHETDGRESLSISVYFSKDPESLDDFTYTRAVTRTTDRTDIGTYTIEQLITGPNSGEASSGLFSPLKGKLQGDSNCNGKDFTLVVTDKIARLRFCKTVTSAGTGDDARITSTISETLEQFSSVDSVIILTRNNNCFGDQSGQNQCLQ